MQTFPYDLARGRHCVSSKMLNILFLYVLLSPIPAVKVGVAAVDGVSIMLCTVAMYTLSFPRAHLYGVGMLRFMSDVNQPSLSTPFYSVLVPISVFISLSTVFHSINSPDNSPFSHSVLCNIGSFNYISLL